MRIFDSNLLIYSYQPQYRSFLIPMIYNQDSRVSVINKVEVLGYHKITLAEKLYFETLFQNIIVLNTTSLIYDKAIELKQMGKMSLGDSIIAATALVENLELYTHNTKDFSWIKGLTITDPILK